jgi:hypothetical protein
MAKSIRDKIAEITAAGEAKGIVQGVRVRTIGADRTGTVKRVEYSDVRVVWDSPALPGVTASWVSLERLEPVA